MKKNIRIPQQKRSIEKKEKIIDAAFRAFNQNGFFNTSTDDIADEADFSVGSIYSYFTDKKDILLACLNKFGKTLVFDICREIDSLSDNGKIEDIIREVILILVRSHNGQSHLYHDEINSLKFRDKDVEDYFESMQKTMMDAVVKRMKSKGYAFRYPPEQSYLLYQLLESLEDEFAFNDKSHISHDILLQECVRIIASMLIKIK